MPNAQLQNTSQIFESYGLSDASRLNPLGIEQQKNGGYDSDFDDLDDLIVDDINEDQEMEHNRREYITSSFDDMGQSEDERILLDRDGNPLPMIQNHPRQHYCMMPVKTELARGHRTTD